MKKSNFRRWQAAQIKTDFEPLKGIVFHTTIDLTNTLTTYYEPVMQPPPYTALLLTKKNHLIGWADITRHQKSGPIIDTAKLLGSVDATQCHRVVVVHLGPVSDESPLDGEYMLCFKLQMVLASHGVYLKDLIIWSDDDYFSFEEEGMVMEE